MPEVLDHAVPPVLVYAKNVIYGEHLFCTYFGLGLEFE